MIFWTKDIGVTKMEDGMTVIGKECTLKDGREGFFLGDDKKDYIESIGVTVEEIKSSDIVSEMPK